MDAFVDGVAETPERLETEREPQVRPTRSTMEPDSDVGERPQARRGPRHTRLSPSADGDRRNSSFANPATMTMIDETDHRPALLIVDSNPVVLRTTGRAMERRGFAPVPVATLAEARGTLPSTRFRFAIIEQRVADGSGLELITDVKRARSDARIVVLTSFGSVEHAVAAARAGADDYLMKPIDANSIAAALRGGGARLDENQSFPHPGQQELNYLLTIFEQHNRNMSESARAIGMHRRTLQRILRRHGIAPGNTQALPAMGQIARQRRLYRLWMQLLETGSAHLAPLDDERVLHHAAE